MLVAGKVYNYGSVKAWKTLDFFLLLCGHDGGMMELGTG